MHHATTIQGHTHCWRAAGSHERVSFSDCRVLNIGIVYHFCKKKAPLSLLCSGFTRLKKERSLMFTFWDVGPSHHFLIGRPNSS